VSPLTWHIDSYVESTVVAVHGIPDASSVMALHAALAHHLARRPHCLMIDLPEMSPADRGTVTGSALWVQHSSIASGTAMLLSRTPFTAVRAARQRMGRRAALMRRFDQAREALAVGLLRSPSFVEQVLPVAGAARRSRDIVTHACLVWGLTNLAHAATLLASELVSRTIRQTSTILTVVALLDRDVLYLWVRAGSTPAPGPPAEPEAALEAVVIGALADHWGSWPDGHDTVIWAALPVSTAATR
jgi:hypothetical protein